MGRPVTQADKKFNGSICPLAAGNHGLHKIFFLAVAVVTGTAAPNIAIAQSDTERIRQLERKLEQSLKTIDELATRVKQLEGSKAERPDTAQVAPQLAEPSPAVESSGQIATLQPPVALRGFADVGAGFSGNRGNKGFADGSLDFYLTPQLSEHVKSLIELVFEHDSAGQLSADLERLQVGYTFDSGSTVWLGRFHTPFGYWNTAFHHGQQLQTSILRPQMIDFEDHGGIMPAHTVGLWNTGAIRAGSGKITYDLFVGNAPTISGGTLEPNNSGTSHPGLSVGFNVGYGFGGNADGLKIGVHGYRADVRETNLSTVSRLNMLGVYAAFDTSDWEVIAEHYGFRNQNISGGTGRFGSWSGFAQVGRRYDRWTPYGRVERAVLSQTDNYFGLLASGQSYSRQAIGLRYELTPSAALKLELNRTVTQMATPVSFNQLLMQWAIRF
jgi:hypothetical protein